LIVSILLIVIIILQSNKASSAGSAILGGNDALFQNMKERGLELVITRITIVLGAIFFIISLILFLK
jgi:preprotein translocase subunit SecG